jgi:hypothetical protein
MKRPVRYLIGPRNQDFYSEKHSYNFVIDKLSEVQHLSPIDEQLNLPRTVHFKS